MTIKFSYPTKASRACGREFVVEKYWIKWMLLWQVLEVKRVFYYFYRQKWRAYDDSKAMDMSSYVIHLEGEEDLVDLMIENNCDAADWIEM
ncbi:hypothetical protein R6Q57_019340 [Mikania cordata]